MAGYWGSQYWGAQYWGDQYWGESSGSAQIYDQLLDVELQLYWSSTQEWVPAPAAALYTQSGNARLLFFGSAAQEYVGVLAGTYGQQGNLRITLAPNALQTWLGGAAPGEVLQQADFVLSLRPDGAQSYVPLNLLFVRTEELDYVPPLYAFEGASLRMDFSADVSQASRITFLFGSDAQAWENQFGEDGGRIGVAIYLDESGVRRPIGSVTYQNAEIVLYPNTEIFQRLATALLQGPVDFVVGAYESLPTKSIPMGIEGDSYFTVKVLQQ